ncbi:hypothetical protein [Gordonia soli]|uniref:Uncharacterized protein n=1 Tax=Gordonia soli NBRC 108243 TaxID=1223545 RepID=M0QQD2_9ACTN|nr:hypothetical protein [Gordonia soli]GAC70451.1 hypothetical protein GS4_35_00270 [Gordonia soli NBRC 108243]
MRLHHHSSTPTTTEVPLVVLDDDSAVRAIAQQMFADGSPMGIVGRSYADVVPFMLGNNGRVVALIADVDDPDQLAGAIRTVESRLGTVGSIIRFSADLPSTSHAA